MAAFKKQIYAGVIEAFRRQLWHPVRKGILVGQPVQFVQGQKGETQKLLQRVKILIILG